MAGGKETPRQKMIGMMYLVLTALLALNVSKQILDAFVAIEENIQRGTITQLERGDAAKRSLSEELATPSVTEADAAKKAKIKMYLDIIEKIDKDAGNFIKYIDEVKLDILKIVGEQVEIVKPNDESVIVWKKYDPKTPLLPARLNLIAVSAKDQFDVPMHEIVGSSISPIDPKKHGAKMWKMYLDFRRSVVENTGTYKEGEKQWKLKVKDINQYKTNDELTKLVTKMFDAPGNVINPEDKEALIGIYQELTKLEMGDHHDVKNVHWMGRTFDHAPLVGALASLSSLQNDVLSARAKAVNILKSKISTGEFSFNKIAPLAVGPGVATEGEEVELKVTMAAFDSDNNPKITSSTGSIEVADGMGTVKFKAGSGSDMTVKGTVAIANKSGVMIGKDWEWKIQIAKPQGSISLPEMSVMYTGWKNKVVPVVAGMISSDINVTGGSKEKATWKDEDGNTYNGYFITVTPGTRFVQVALMGTDKDKKTKSFGTFKYKVKPFPKAQVQGSTISKAAGTKVIVSLGADSPFTGVSFTVNGGEILINGEPVPFNGDRIPAAVLSKVKAGKKVSIEVLYTRSGGEKGTASATLKVVP